MAGFAEPSTEDEAQKLKTFLQTGATMSLSTVQTFKAVQVGDAGSGKPAVLVCEATPGQVQKLVSEAGSRILLLTVEVSGIDRDHDYSAAVVVGGDVAATIDSKTPGLVGTIGFFCEVDGPEGVIICPVKPDHALRYQLDATAAIAGAAQPGDPLRISVILQPQPDTQAATSGLSIGAASIDVAESVVKLSG
jgi:hypothetical protein